MASENTPPPPTESGIAPQPPGVHDDRPEPSDGGEQSGVARSSATPGSSSAESEAVESAVLPVPSSPHAPSEPPSDAEGAHPTPRGIQEHRVWAAADALLIAGLHPTIERVRQKLGRGSPNTVSPMLTRWYGVLGKRFANNLGSTPSRATEAPGTPEVPGDGHRTPLPKATDFPPRPMLSDSTSPNPPHAPSGSTSDGESARRGPRGVQEHQVWAAADMLLTEGLRPTIERVRQKLGGGSPNTVSPMLERWFATLATRLTKGPGAAPTNAANVAVAVESPKVAHDQKMPPFMDTFVRKLWEEAQTEARNALARREADAQAAEQRHRAYFEAQSAQLRLEQASFAQARGDLECALVSAHQALRSVQEQLEDAARAQHESEREAARLKHQLAQAHAEQERQRRALAQGETQRAAENRETEERAAEREKRLLSEIEQERSATRLALADLLKEQERKLHAEKELARARDEGCNAPTESLATIEQLRQRLASEEQAHQATRSLLAAALKDKSHGGSAASA
jgi:hypothetical protein